MTAEEVPEVQSGDLVDSLARPLPEGFTRSVVTIDVDGFLPCTSEAVRDALILVTSGAIDVETTDGTRVRFCSGAVLTVADLPHSRLRNSGTEVAHLVTVRRSGAPDQRPVEPPRVEPLA